MLGPQIFLIQILEVSSVMLIGKERLKQEHLHLVAVMEVKTVQFADDCTKLITTSNEWQIDKMIKKG